jgi:hypothetical protein
MHPVEVIRRDKIEEIAGSLEGPCTLGGTDGP